MTLQDLTANRERIIKKINSQITMATQQNITAVMQKMVAMLPQFAAEKATLSNIDKLTMKATLSYIKYGHTFNTEQGAAVDAAYRLKQLDAMPSSLK